MVMPVQLKKDCLRADYKYMPQDVLKGAKFLLLQATSGG